MPVSCYYMILFHDGGPKVRDFGLTCRYYLINVAPDNNTSVSAEIHMWVQDVGYNLFSLGVFLPCFTMLILSLPLLGLGSKSTSLSSVSVYQSQSNAIRFVGSWISYLDSLFFPFFFYWESKNASSVLQEAENADSRACTRSYVSVRLSHFYQGCHVHCLVIIFFSTGLYKIFSTLHLEN